jgi:hypothetical protein
MEIPTSVMIAITELKEIAAGEPDYAKRVEKVMAAAVKHWMVVDEQEQFKAACGALMLTSPDQKAEIESQLSALRNLSALVSGVPVDLDAMLAESEAAPKVTVGLREAFLAAKDARGY